MKKQTEQIAYSVRSGEGKELLSLDSASAIDFTFKTIDSNEEKPLFVHKLVKENLGGDYRDLGTIRSTKKAVAYYVYCDDVKKRDFYGKIEGMNDNGYFEMEFDKIDDAFEYAVYRMKEANLKDDFLVFVERIDRELDEDGDVVNEEYEDVKTFDKIGEIYKNTLEGNRFTLDKIKRNICGDSPAEELARIGINRLLEIDFRYDYVVEDAHLDCFEFESEIRDLDEIADVEVSEELIEEAVKIFIATANKLNVPLVHDEEY